MASSQISREGFTLLELIAVIGIIAIMSVLVVGGFNGILKAFGETAGADSVRRSIMLARQQACVDGEHMYFQLTGYNTYCIVRRAGTITERAHKSKKPLNENLNLYWISDDYASTADGLSGLTDLTGFSNQDQHAIWDDYVERFSEMKVYDMTAHVASEIECPMFYDSEDDTWSFAITSEAYSRGFREGNDYGWVVSPEQSLPKGMVFEGTYSAASGEVNESAIEDGFIHFLPDGSVDQSSGTRTYKIIDPTTGRGAELEVNGMGNVTISTIK